MNHTSGPWECIYLLPTRTRAKRQIVGGGRGVVCIDWANDSDDLNQEGIANSRLIAAAPELLAALIGLMGCIEAEWGADVLPYILSEPNDKRTSEAILAARALIAKATEP